MKESLYIVQHLGARQWEPTWWTNGVRPMKIHNNANAPPAVVPLPQAVRALNFAQKANPSQSFRVFPVAERSRRVAQ